MVDVAVVVDVFVVDDLVVVVVIVVVVIVIVSVITSGCFVLFLFRRVHPLWGNDRFLDTDFQLLLLKKKKMCKVQVDTIGNVCGGRGRVLSCVT